MTAAYLPAEQELSTSAPPAHPLPPHGRLKLNIGAGGSTLPGFINVDDKTGHSIYPLPDWVADGSCAEIRASHVLEHFGHQEAEPLLDHWVSKLAPGGRIRIAVPNFDIIVDTYRSGQPLNPQGYVMGSQTDKYDFHKSIWSEPLLTDVLFARGLHRIGTWQSELQDCAALPISLNLEGHKPLTEFTRPRNTHAVLSCPRFGPIIHQTCAHAVFSPLGIPYTQGYGSNWYQVMSEELERAIARPDCEFVLACDFDTVFEADDVFTLWDLMQAFPEIDALVPVQSKRSSPSALFNMFDAAGNQRQDITTDEFTRFTTKIDTGHFGLTLFRADSLRKFKRPWMVGSPHPQTGRWQDGAYPNCKIDPDIHFWLNFREQGFNVHLANRVLVGHLDEIITWPHGKDFTPVYQTGKDYREGGRPVETSIPCC